MAGQLGGEAVEGCNSLRLVVGVAVPLPPARRACEGGRGIAQRQGNGGRRAGLEIGLDGRPGEGEGIALRRRREIDGCLEERESALRQPEPVDRVARCNGRSNVPSNKGRFSTASVRARSSS